MSSDYGRGYQDGIEAAMTAKANTEAETILGEFVGSVLQTIEEIIAGQCNVFESDEYQEGFRDGVESTH